MEFYEYGLINKGRGCFCPGPGPRGRAECAGLAWKKLPGAGLRFELAALEKIAAPADVVICRIPLAGLRRRLGAGELRMLVNSGNIDNGSAGLIRLGSRAGKRDPAAPKPQSQWWTVLGDPAAGRFRLYGFLPPVQHRTFLRIRGEHLECGCRLQRALQPGDVFATDALVEREGADAHRLLEDFGAECARLTPGRVSAARAVGWNSWDYYFCSFEQDDLEENLRALREFQRSTGVRVGPVVIDMGWFTDFGDWRANGRFPGGLKAAAGRIAAAGFTPGLWVAPFIVHYHTRSMYRHPEICATDENGRVVIDNWGLAPNGFLDPTHPRGAEFLFAWFREFCAAGFRYFKLDFIHYLATHAETRRFHENHLGRIEIIRRGLGIIREAVGPKAYLLACGCPPEAVIGLADACRIGGDISTYFSTTRVQAAFLAARYWMNGRFFIGDPDFLVVRGPATADDAQPNPCHPSNAVDQAGSRSGPAWQGINEPRIWATLVGMSGGALTLADHLGKLNGPGREMLRQVIRHAAREAARPLDLMEELRPAFWLRAGSRPALAVINWSDEKQTLRIPREACAQAGLDLRRARDVWRPDKDEGPGVPAVIPVPARDAVWFVNPGRGLINRNRKRTCP